MSLDHALLVSLLEKPNSGYALAQLFDRSIGHFWHATHQQIYRVLQRMEAAGWIVGEVERGETAPDRKVFRVTPDGRTALVEWLGAPGEIETPRSALMVRLRGAAFDDAARLVPELQRQRARHAEQLAAYRAIEARDFAQIHSTQHMLQHQVLKFGLAYEQTWIDWCDATLARIEQPTKDAP